MDCGVKTHTKKERKRSLVGGGGEKKVGPSLRVDVTLDEGESRERTVETVGEGDVKKERTASGEPPKEDRDDWLTHQRPGRVMKGQRRRRREVVRIETCQVGISSSLEKEMRLVWGAPRGGVR